MNESAPGPAKFGASDYLALERTFLAWIRTGLALMGFGFVVARFGLFLQMIQVTRVELPHRTLGLSLWFGMALIVAGVAALVFSTWRYVRMVRNFSRGEETFQEPVTSAVVIAVLLAAIGAAMAIYLVSV
ncbi:MAG: YidH family protein [Candidatus Acidiferrales bacterium]